MLQFVPNNDPDKTGVFKNPDGTVFGVSKQGFGDTEYARTSGVYKNKLHPGVDISLTNPQVPAFTSGEVVFVGEKPGWGGQVIIRDNQGILHHYSHLRHFDVAQGQRVNKGTPLGLMGGGKGDPMAGTSTGRHLDYAVKRGNEWIEPYQFITGQGGSTGQQSADMSMLKQEVQRRMQANPQFRTMLEQRLAQANPQNQIRQEIQRRLQTNPNFRTLLEQKLQQQTQRQPQDLFRQTFDSIVKQESGGNYQAIGPAMPHRSDRALGRYQIMEANLPSWSQQYLGRQVGREEFINNPQIQDQIAMGRMGDYWKRAESLGLAPEDRARYVSMAWYGGQGRADSRVQNGKFVYNQADLAKQRIAGGTAPSVKEYGDSIISRLNI